MITFKYNPTDSFLTFLASEVKGFSGSSLDGILDPICCSYINLCSLFLVCNERSTENAKFYTTPYAVVAKTQQEAADHYTNYMIQNNASDDFIESLAPIVVAEINHNCAKLKVIA